MAYAYFGYKGFVLLSWVLISFIMHLIPFVEYTVKLILPIFTFEFLFIYFVNIPGIFNSAQFEEHWMLNWFGYEIRTPALEIGIMFYSLSFFILLIPSKGILRLARDELRLDLFKVLSDKNSSIFY
jgi:hypothetical protein